MSSNKLSMMKNHYRISGASSCRGVVLAINLFSLLCILVSCESEGRKVGRTDGRTEPSARSEERRVGKECRL